MPFKKTRRQKIRQSGFLRFLSGIRLQPLPLLQAGEATNLRPDYNGNYTSIDWQGIRGFRNRIVNDYFGIDYYSVWEIKENFF